MKIDKENQLMFDINERIDIFKRLIEFGAVHIGSSAFTRTGKDPEVDIDVAVTNKIVLKLIDEDKFNILTRIHSSVPTYVAGDNSLKYEANGEILKCDYLKNKKTLWTAVNKIIWKSGISMDLLFYEKYELEAVRETMPMLLANKDIWSSGTKNKRIKLFESLVVKIYKLNKNDSK